MTVALNTPHLLVGQVPEHPRGLGFQDGLAGEEPSPARHSELWDRQERARYFQGHIRGVLARIVAQRTAPPVPQPITVEPWEMSA